MALWNIILPACVPLVILALASLLCRLRWIAGKMESLGVNVVQGAGDTDILLPWADNDFLC